MKISSVALPQAVGLSMKTRRTRISASCIFIPPIRLMPTYLATPSMIPF